MEANYVHKDSTTLIQDKLVKNELNQIELQYNALKQQKFNELLKENKKLKEKIKRLSQWDINKDTRNSRQRVANAKLLKENQELKKQVEENKDNYNCLLKQKEQFEYIMSKQVDYQGQQKEFINYLNSYIDLLNDKPDMLEETQKDILEEILQKYKSIIGVLDEKK